MAGQFVYTQAFTIFMVPHGVITVSILTAGFVFLPACA